MPTWILVLSMAPISAAADGRIEINQVCAENIGCLGGDGPGFPVTLTQPGSYVLTGDLTPPDGVVGIQIEADDIAIDLNGFGISGGLSCVPDFCGGTGPAKGISVPATPTNNGRRCSVRNGTIRGTYGNAIELRDEAFVDEVLVANAYNDGMSLGSNSLVTRSRIIGVGRYGLFLGLGSGYADNVVASTGQLSNVGGISGGKALGGNVCDDGTCTTRRRYYLDDSFSQGSGASCRQDFHVASLWELMNPGLLFYDRWGEPGLGSGPPIASGWAYTESSFDDWTSLSGTGGVITLEPTPTFSERIGPWRVESSPCDSFIRVWCIED